MNILRKTRVSVSIAVLFFLSLPFSACAPRMETHRLFALGTVCGISLFESGKQDVFLRIDSRLTQLEGILSAHGIAGGTSELERVNQNAGIQAVPVSGDFMTVLLRALYFAELTGGAFDPSIGPLVKLWGIGGEKERRPGEEEIIDARARVNYRDVVVDTARQTVYLRHSGMSLDLGGIAKGYAADEIVKILKEAAIQRAIIDLGGNVYALGSKSKKQKWRIGIQNPLAPRGEYLAVEEAADKTLVTSGVYERFFEENGVRYHHILDAKTGYPAVSGLLSVTIIAENSMDADALSTALFVLGYEKGAALLSQLPGVEAVFVFEDSSIKRTGSTKLPAVLP
jgi:thiamine biosynthesis lipoprotein